MSTLVIAEKPSVARDIARVLGASQKGEGCLEGNGYVVSWAIGHLVSLKEPEELDERYKHWNTQDLPILPAKMELKVLPKTRSQFSVLKKLMARKEVETLICATDSGREGELIFRYIYQMAGCKKPFQRLWISSMTDEAIRDGFSRLRPGTDYDALYESARCRSEADWLIGMNASRAFTLRYHVLLSVGRVQTPTLQMLVKRRHEIDSFVPEDYYMVNAVFDRHQGTWFDSNAEGYNTRIDRKEAAESIAQKVRGKSAVITKVQKESKTELPPLLYDLTTLQRDANNLLGFTADKTLKVAQSLYEKYKLVTYPRTDSRYLSHDMPGSVQKALSVPVQPYADLSVPILQKPLPVSKRIFDDSKVTDHHAIIPTGRKWDPDTLPQDEGKLLDLVFRRLIAAFYPAHRYENTRVITVCEGESFITNGKTEIEPGFTAVMPKSSRKQAAEDVPDLREGEATKVHRADVKKDKTKPPAEYTDATLLSAMEHAGRAIEDEALREQMKGTSLGTPATRAAIIERLLQVGYARRKGRLISATEKGVRLIEAVPQEIASPETTARWEEALEKMAHGGGDSERFLAGIRRLATFLCEYAAANAPDCGFEPEPFRKKKGRRTAAGSIGIPCPVCGKGTVTENEKAFGCSRWKENCGFTIWKNSVTRLGGPEITEKIVKALLAAPDGQLKGSTGTLVWKDGKVSFEKRR